MPVNEIGTHIDNETGSCYAQTTSVNAADIPSSYVSSYFRSFSLATLFSQDLIHSYLEAVGLSRFRYLDANAVTWWRAKSRRLHKRSKEWSAWQRWTTSSVTSNISCIVYYKKYLLVKYKRLCTVVLRLRQLRQYVRYCWTLQRLLSGAKSSA